MVDESDRAAVRVNWTRRVLIELETRDRAAHERVLGRMGEAHTLPIERAGLLAWLPCRHHLALCEAIRDELGDEGLTRHFCHATLAAGRLPLFRGIAEAALRMFGPSPASVARAGPQAWRAIFRDMGTYESSPGDEPNSVVSVMRVTEGSMRRRDTFALGLEGGLWACLELTGRQGVVTRDLSAYRDRGVAVFQTRWDR